MNAPIALAYSQLDLPLLGRGKVRDIYRINDDYLLLVASDRLSAFDVILPDPIPGKGRLLTQISSFWFNYLNDIVPNHIIDKPLTDYLGAADIATLDGRGMLVQRLTPLPIEAVVRGYLAGSGWRDYQTTGTICGVNLPTGLQQAAKLPEPIFTPATKAAQGDHDENIAYTAVRDIIGSELAAQVRDISLKLYQTAAAYAAERGIIIADTKFEFGLDANGKLIWLDEALTPDSSRFWPAEQYQLGISPPSFDKQYVRDYLNSLDWNKQPPAPNLPTEVIQQTQAKYEQARRLLVND